MEPRAKKFRLSNTSIYETNQPTTSQSSSSGPTLEALLEPPTEPVDHNTGVGSIDEDDILPTDADDETIIGDKAIRVLDIIHSNRSLASTPHFQREFKLDQTPEEVACTMMDETQLSMYQHWKKNFTLPSFNPATDFETGVITGEGPSQRARRVTALERLYGRRGLDDRHYKWWIKKYNWAAPLLTAMVRIIGVERDRQGGDMTISSNDHMELRAINRVLGVFQTKARKWNEENRRMNRKIQGRKRNERNRRMNRKIQEVTHALVARSKAIKPENERGTIRAAKTNMRGFPPLGKPDYSNKTRGGRVARTSIGDSAAGPSGTSGLSREVSQIQHEEQRAQQSSEASYTGFINRLNDPAREPTCTPSSPTSSTNNSILSSNA